MPQRRVVTATRVVPAAPERVFDLLADARQHPRLDGSGTVRAVREAPPRLFLGATFSMGMRLGLPYVTRNRVVVFDEGRAIAWHHPARFVWRYDLEPVAEGTRVTESFDYSVPWGRVIEWLGWPARNRSSMEATLERLAALVAPATAD